MIYTFGQLKEAVKHAIGGIPDGARAPQRFTEGQIVNRAISHIYNAHAWSWRKKLASLSLTSGVTYVDLPDDFGELISVTCNTVNLPATIRPASTEDFAMVTGQPWTGTSLVYSLTGTTQATPTSAPVSRLGIGPPPSSNISNALILWYYRMVPSFAAVGTADDAKVPDMPVRTHHVLLSLCRAYAISTEDQQTEPEWQEASRLLQEAVTADQRSEANYDNAAGPSSHTFGALKGQASQVLGTANPGVNLGRLVNDAQQMVFTASPWWWQEQTVNVTVTGAGPNDVLPATAIDIVRVTGPSGAPVRIVPYEQLLTAEAKSLALGGEYLASLTYNARATANDNPVPAIRVYPRTANNVFSVVYLYGADRMFDDNHQSNMPPIMFPLLSLAVKHLADKHRPQPSGSYEALYKESLAQMKEFDARQRRREIVTLDRQIPSRRGRADQ